MKVFVGGLVALFLGIIGIFAFFGDFLHLLAGAVPLVLLLGGAMATYLGYDEVKDQVDIPFVKKSQPVEPHAAEDMEKTSKYKEELEKYKAEIEKLKAELKKKTSSSED